MGRCRCVCCLSCLRVTGVDAGTGSDEASCCLRVAVEATCEDEEQAAEVDGVSVEPSCLRVMGGDGEEEEEEEEDAWRPLTSSLALAAVLLLVLVLLRTTSASLFTALLSSLGMILAR